MELKLKAQRREEVGKGPARRLRDRGEIPAVLYGLGVESSPLSVKSVELSEVLGTKAGSNVLIDLEVIDGKKKENHLVMVKEIQRHPFKEKLIHVDFLKVTRDEKVTTKVPITVTGQEESVGLKDGGTLQHALWEVEVECLPADMPERLFADVTELDIGDNLKVADISFPREVTVMDSPEDTVLNILAPRLVEEEVPELEEELAEEMEEAEEEMEPGKEKPEEAPPPPEGEES